MSLEAKLNKPDLSGRGILITRPLAQAKQLAELVQHYGGEAFIFPTLEITFSDTTKIHGQLKSLNNKDTLIFVSANAVKGVFDTIGDTLSLKIAKCNIAAIGSSTQAALTSFGICVNLVANEGQQTSEGLLCHPDLQHLSGTRIVIIRAQSGREMLRETLQARGGRVDYIQSYTRQIPRQFNTELVIKKLKNKHINCILLSSYDAFFNLTQMLQGNIEILLADKNLIVPSERIAQKIRLQFSLNVTVASNASNAAMLASI